MMESNRFPRFRRAAAVAPMQVTERDREIIRQVHRHRFLRSSHIAELLDDHSQQLLRRLQLLYHHGYLERPRSQIDYFHRGGSRHIVYGLGNKGGLLLTQELGASFRERRFGEKSRSVGRVYLEHALLVSDVMVALELACRRTGNVRLIAWDKLLSPDNVDSPSKVFKWTVKAENGRSLGLVPDRAFALETRNQDGTSHRAYFFLEADRGTMPVIRKNPLQSSFHRKMLAYEATWSQAIHQTRFGFHRFRVLTVTTSAERVRSLVNACSQLKSGHGLFLFADAATLRACGDLFNLHWKTGRMGETSRLLD